MANQDGQFHYVDGPRDEDELRRMVDAAGGDLSELLRSITSMSEEEVEALKAQVAAEVAAIPDEAFLRTSMSLLNDQAKQFVGVFLGAAKHDRIHEVLTDETRAALLAIAEAVERAALLFQEAIAAGEPLTDETFNNDMVPVLEQVNEHIRALGEE